MFKKEIKTLLSKNFLLLKQGPDSDLAILDDVFPFPNSPWRNQEFLEYDKHFRVELISDLQDTNRKIPSSAPFGELLAEFNKRYPNHLTVKRLSLFTKTNPKLVYFLFYNYLLNYFDQISAKRYNLAFTLYPGGGFEINNQNVDKTIQKAGDYAHLKFVIVNQKFTKNYLIDKGLLPQEKVFLINGGPIPVWSLKKTEHSAANYIRLAFVANKYTPQGKDKGFDVLQDIAEELLRRKEVFKIRCVGGFTESDLNNKDLLPYFEFSPFAPASFFDGFYKDIDLFISPNKPFVASLNSFDGFPIGTAVEAGVRGIPMFLTDHLDENDFLVHGKDFWNITHKAPKETVDEMLDLFYNNRDLLFKIGENGAEKLKDFFSYEKQLLPRVKLMSQFLE